MYLPFGLRTTPFLFNLFAKALNWILLAVLFWPIVIDYLDDFLSIFPPHTDFSFYSTQFDRLCQELGILVNYKKDVAGTTADFTGFELDTLKMEARLPSKKLLWGRTMIEAIFKKKSVHRAELDSPVGFLSFASKVIFPGRAFLRRLYNALAESTTFIHISSERKKDLQWWHTYITS